MLIVTFNLLKHKLKKGPRGAAWGNILITISSAHYLSSDA